MKTPTVTTMISARSSKASVRIDALAPSSAASRSGADNSWLQTLPAPSAMWVETDAVVSAILRPREGSCASDAALAPAEAGAPIRSSSLISAARAVSSFNTSASTRACSAGIAVSVFAPGRTWAAAGVGDAKSAQAAIAIKTAATRLRLMRQRLFKGNLRRHAGRKGHDVRRGIPYPQIVKFLSIRAISQGR